MSHVQVDTWRAAYRGVVPDDYLDNLSYEDSERRWRDIIADGNGVFVVEDEDGIFGFASGLPRKKFSQGLAEYEGELKSVYVLPSRQGVRAGRRLVEEVARYLVEQGVNSMLLWVFADNHAARRFYESLGGVLVAEDGFEIGGVWLKEVAYGWTDLGALLADA